MKIFEYCPRCKSSGIFFDNRKQFKCSACSFTYFHNVATAAAAILEYDRKIILIKRAREPGKGKLDLPGGFTDPEETAEDGLNREIKEELGITLDKMKYIGSSPNVYKYKDVTYS
jgi:NAD+ diphosphatase